MNNQMAFLFLVFVAVLAGCDVKFGESCPECDCGEPPPCSYEAFCNSSPELFNEQVIDPATNAVTNVMECVVINCTINSTQGVK